MTDLKRRPGSQTRVRMQAVAADEARWRSDVVATEEPLEIRLAAPNGADQTVTVTMRTPGADFELAVGFLFSEGLVAGRAQVRQIRYCLDASLAPEQHYNVVTVELCGAELPDLGSLDRYFAMTSACGVCGKASLDQIARRGIVPLGADWQVAPSLIAGLPAKLERAQGLFASTGGLHAAGLFDRHGELLAVREDVGRHNAVDKAIGWALLEDRLPLREHILLVSGRASFEIAQKCAAAGIPLLCAVSAPSSLAIDVARRFNLTLVGFLRGDRYNIYHGTERITLPASIAEPSTPPTL